MTDVFISYSRRDKAFVRALCHALLGRGHHLWVDWDGIRSSLPWREEITSGIRQATRFVYLVSPDAIASPFCDWEVEQALALQKKLIPVLCREVDIDTVRSDVSSLQFISFCGEDDFITALDKLEGAITADLDYDRMFAKLDQQAQEWVRRDRHDGWLRGADLEDAELWLANSIGKTPPPSDLQRAYIIASRRERQAELERWQTLYEESEKRRITAEQNEITAFCKSSDAFFALDRPLDALIEALQAGVRFRDADWTTNLPDLRAQVMAALQQGLYWVREVNRLEGHNGTVRDVSISPDGELIVTASRDGTLRLWQRNGYCLAVLHGHENMVRTVDFAPDGQSFVSGSWDGTVRLWSRSGDELKVLSDHGDRVIHVAFSPAGDCFASAGSDGTVKLWTPEGQLITSLDNGRHEQRCVAFSPDGQWLASGSRNGTIHLWLLKGDHPFICQQSIEVSERALNTVCFSHDSQWIVSGSVDGCIRAWCYEQNYVHDLVVQTAEVRAIQQMPTTEDWVSVGHDGLISIWQVSDFCPEPNEQLPAQVSENDPQSSTCSHPPKSFQLTLKTTLAGHSGPVLGLDIDRTGTMILSAGGERVTRLWHWNVPQLVRCTTGETGSYGLSFDARGDRLLVSGQKNSIQIWQKNGTLLKSFVAHASGVWNVCLSPNDDLLATAGGSKTIKLWTSDGELKATLTGHQGLPRQLCFSPDGLLLASASDDGTVRLWNTQGELQNIFQSETDRLTSVCFAPDGQSLVAGSRNRVLRHWHLDGTLLRTFAGHEDEVLDVEFTPDGRYLISGSDDRTACIWQVDGVLLRTLECQRSVRGVDVSPCGTVIATGCRDGTIRFWSMDGVLLSILHGRSGQIVRVRFSPDGRSLAATSDEGMLTIWQLDPFDDELLERLIDRGLDWCKDYFETNPTGQNYRLRGTQ
ncbi:MAG: TIR domain-containing protein [Leptolyngbyaceae bacterium]|nr:TIR domain-containing protein [Leptolyngbyaceae bacterium]